MLGVGICAAVVGVSRDVGSIAFSSTARDCCRVSVGGGAFCCASAPCVLVVCTGEAIVGSFAWHWATNNTGDGKVSRSGPYWSGIGDACSLRPVPSLV